MQLTLSFLKPPTRPEAEIWRRLTSEQRQAVVDQLAHLIVKTAVATARQEPKDD